MVGGSFCEGAGAEGVAPRRGAKRGVGGWSPHVARCASSYGVIEVAAAPPRWRRLGSLLSGLTHRDGSKVEG